MVSEAAVFLRFAPSPVGPSARRHGLLEPHEAEGMLPWDHGGGLLAFGS